MEKSISETNRRRKIQMEYNEKHGITPQSIKKDIRDDIKATFAENDDSEYITEGKDINQIIDELTVEMLSYAEKMEFEKAAEIRDKIKALEELK